MISTKLKIKSNELLKCNIYKIVLQVEEMPEIQCGQFAMLSCGTSDGIVLKRPISIHDFDKDTVTFIYETVGKGTKSLSKIMKGTYIDVIFPLGKGFDTNEYKRIALVGGGLGIFPLYSVIKKYPNLDYYAYLGCRDESKFVCDDIFEVACQEMTIATDDGSKGIKGFVTDFLQKDLCNKNFDAIFACGPKPMLKALKSATKDADIPVFVSMEERMGCGFGACLTCTCKTDKGNKRVCVDGPVFDINEVIL